MPPPACHCPTPSWASPSMRIICADAATTRRMSWPWRWGSCSPFLSVPACCAVRRDSPHQTGLSAAQRQRNAAGSFQAADVRGLHLWLVDDIITTGSTLRAACAELHRAGPRAWMSWPWRGRPVPEAPLEMAHDKNGENCYICPILPIK